MRVHGVHVDRRSVYTVGSGFCMIAVEFGENVMALIRCIGQGRGWGSGVSARSWHACWEDGIDWILMCVCVCVCGCVYWWEALCFVLVVSVFFGRRWNI